MRSGAQQIGLDGRTWWQTAVVTVLLLWPLLLFGHPGYFNDSLSYYRGGKFAVGYVLSKVPAASHVMPQIVGQAKAQSTTPLPMRAPAPRAEPGKPAAATGGGAPAGDAKGARSVFYSVLTYLFSWPGVSLAGLAILQAATCALVMLIAARVLAGDAPGLYAAGITAVVAPAAIFSCYAMPDIFAGVLVLCVVILALGFSALSTAARAAVGTIAIAAIAFHASHIPLAIGLVPIALAMHFYVARPSLRAVLMLGGALLCCIILAIAATMVASWVGYGQASIAAKRFPLTLARSIEDGPARWYLQEECRRPRYAVCEIYGTDLPTNAGMFLWGPTGLDERATPEQLERVRAEEQDIVVRAALRYPGQQARFIVTNVLRQLVSFSSIDVRFDWRIAETGGKLDFATGTASRQPLALTLNWIATIIATGAALLVLVVRFRRAHRSERAATVLLLAGLVINAAICAIFSGVADRYQARAIWILPFAAMVFATAPLTPVWKRGEVRNVRVT
jgi:hypothetical protein